MSKVQHDWTNRRCTRCGASRAMLQTSGVKCPISIDRLMMYERNQARTLIKSKNTLDATMLRRELGWPVSTLKMERMNHDNRRSDQPG